MKHTAVSAFEELPRVGALSQSPPLCGAACSSEATGGLFTWWSGGLVKQ